MNAASKVRVLCGLFALLFLVLSMFSFMGHSNNGDGIYEELFIECKAEAPQPEQLTGLGSTVPTRAPAYVESQQQAQRNLNLHLHRAVNFLVFSLLCSVSLPSNHRTAFFLTYKAATCGRELLIRFEHRSDGKK